MDVALLIKEISIQQQQLDLVDSIAEGNKTEVFLKLVELYKQSSLFRDDDNYVVNWYADQVWNNDLAKQSSGSFYTAMASEDGLVHVFDAENKQDYAIFKLYWNQIFGERSQLI